MVYVRHIENNKETDPETARYYEVAKLLETKKKLSQVKNKLFTYCSVL